MKNNNVWHTAIQGGTVKSNQRGGVYMAAARDSITEVEFNKMMTTGLAPAKADDSAGTGHSGYLSKKRSACQTCRYGMGITSDLKYRQDARCVI